MRWRRGIGSLTPEQSGDPSGRAGIRWPAGVPAGAGTTGRSDVLYTSETRRTAIEERRFHLLQGQPIVPSRVRYEMYELRVSLEAVMRFVSLDGLADLQLDIRELRQTFLFRSVTRIPALPGDRRSLRLPGSRRHFGTQRAHPGIEQSRDLLRTGHPAPEGYRPQSRRDRFRDVAVAPAIIVISCPN